MVEIPLTSNVEGVGWLNSLSIFSSANCFNVCPFFGRKEALPFQYRISQPMIRNMPLMLKPSTKCSRKGFRIIPYRMEIRQQIPMNIPTSFVNNDLILSMPSIIVYFDCIVKKTC